MPEKTKYVPELGIIVITYTGKPFYTREAAEECLRADGQG